MARYPHLVDVAWNIVEKLVADWKANPHYWESEIDVQAELRSRLATAYSLMGKGEVVGEKLRRPDSTEKITYRYSRVACEPTILLNVGESVSDQIKPDVVVWDDPVDPTQHMGDNDRSWPILWACEIKYLDAYPTSHDLQKLKSLIQQKRIAYGCWLTFNFDKKTAKEKPIWDQCSEGVNLWVCNARVSGE